MTGSGPPLLTSRHWTADAPTIARLLCDAGVGAWWTSAGSTQPSGGAHVTPDGPVDDRPG
ncbi:hypothetical protein [Cellulomonas aerilata]|uniref:Uncharacterized protein n=1 Tax=Cellulomonas aerilata TaxID=515326 RepID=A0A512D7B1_9CELL|nr:hypothetical protein [Cellulomonas aerilata]GEO32366.1 hypothetical protein CAE01nite_00910 [Cellulomonas aerilata]